MDHRFRPHRVGRGFLRTVLFVCLVLVLCGCSESTREKSPPLTDEAKRAAIEKMYAEYKKSFPEVPEVTVDELIALQADGNVVIVDGREPAERAVSMIPDAISKETFEQDIESYRDSTIVAHCTIGYRSGKYAAELRKKGLNAFNLKGSILSWVHAGREVVDSEGRPTRRVHVYGEKWNLLPEGYEAEW
jgi:rhodanese-related sulfurtransferase